MSDDCKINIARPIQAFWFRVADVRDSNYSRKEEYFSQIIMTRFIQQPGACLSVLLSVWRRT
jgi:hypothetical protein